MTFEQWLRAPAQLRCYLIECQYRMGGQLHTLRRATMPYRTHAGDSPAFTPYPETITSMGSYEREMTDAFMGFTRTSLSEIQLFLDDELRALYQSANFAGQSLTIKMGDPEWALNAFQTVVNAAIVRDVSASNDTLFIAFNSRDSLLDKPIQSELYTSGDNEGKPKPICYGRCRNVSPVLIEPINQTYQVSDGPVSALTAVRESGQDVPYTDNGDGTFTLTNNPSGTITADVDGAVDGVWLQSAQAIIDHILTTRCGLSASAGELPGYLIGLYIDSKRSVADVLDEIVSSVGGSWSFNRDGQLQLMTFSGVEAPVDSLGLDDIEDDSLSPVRRYPPIASINLGYARNWTVQDDGLAGIVRENSPQLAQRYGTEYLRKTATNAGITTDYPDAASVTVDTLLVNAADAQAEADKRAQLAAVPRHLYSVQALAAPFAMSLGQSITIDYPQYFDGGVDALITRINHEFDNQTTSLEVWR